MNNVADARARKRSKKTPVKRKAPPTNDEYVKVVPLLPKDNPEYPNQISKARRAKAAKVTNGELTFQSTLGYRSVQTSKGAWSGAWYFEINVDFLGETGHCRLGVGTSKQEIEAPCGYTEHSFGYRDVDGSRVHVAGREAYGRPFGEGDVVGVYLYLPEGGRCMEGCTQVVRWRGKLYQTVVEPYKAAKQLDGSVLGFFVNGEWQGVAFRDFKEGTYYAAASLFTKPNPEKPATVTFNLGPEFKYPPPAVVADVPDAPPARPFCDVPNPAYDLPPTEAEAGPLEDGDGVKDGTDGGALPGEAMAAAVSPGDAMDDDRGHQAASEDMEVHEAGGEADVDEPMEDL